MSLQISAKPIPRRAGPDSVLKVSHRKMIEFDIRWMWGVERSSLVFRGLNVTQTTPMSRCWKSPIIGFRLGSDPPC